MLLARIRGTREQLRTLESTGFRFHRTGVRKISATLFEVPGVLDVPEVGLLELWGYQVTVDGDVKELLSKRLKQPRARVQPFGASTELFSSVMSEDGYMEVAFIENWVQSLSLLFPALSSILTCPNQTWEGRTVSAIRLAPADQRSLRSVVFASGVHAAELGGPDSCIYFIARLVNAYVTGSSLV